MTHILNTLPSLSTELIDELDKAFPSKVPARNSSREEIGIAIGKRELIDFLIELKKRDEADIIKT